MFKKILLFPFITLWIGLSLIVTILIWSLIDSIFIKNYQYFEFLYLGIVVYLISLVFIKPYRYKFWDTFWHEFSHIVFAVLTFSKVHKLMVSPDNSENGAAGYIQYSFKPNKILGFIRGHLVSLAPYFFSPITVVLVFIYWIILPTSNSNFFMQFFEKEPTLNGLLFFIGLTYIYHIVTSFKQAKPYQSDFDSVGYIYGIFFVVFMQLFMLLFIIIILTYNFGSFDIVMGSYDTIIQNIDFDKIFEIIKNTIERVEQKL